MDNNRNTHMSPDRVKVAKPGTKAKSRTNLSRLRGLPAAAVIAMTTSPVVAAPPSTSLQNPVLVVRSKGATANFVPVLHVGEQPSMTDPHGIREINKHTIETVLGQSLTIRMTDPNGEIARKENHNLALFRSLIAVIRLRNPVGSQLEREAIFLESERRGMVLSTFRSMHSRFRNDPAGLEHALGRNPRATSKAVEDYLRQPAVAQDINVRMSDMRGGKAPDARLIETMVRTAADDLALQAHPQPFMLELRTPTVFSSSSKAPAKNAREPRGRLATNADLGALQAKTGKRYLSRV